MDETRITIQPVNEVPPPPPAVVMDEIAKAVRAENYRIEFERCCWLIARGYPRADIVVDDSVAQHFLDMKRLNEDLDRFEASLPHSHAELVARPMMEMLAEMVGGEERLLAQARRHAGVPQ